MCVAPLPSSPRRGFHLSRENFSCSRDKGKVGITASVPVAFRKQWIWYSSKQSMWDFVTRISQTASPALSYWAFDPLPVDLKGHIQFSESEVLAFPAGMCLLQPMLLEGCFIYCAAACRACVYTSLPLCVCGTQSSGEFAAEPGSLLIKCSSIVFVWMKSTIRKFAYKSDTLESLLLT